MLFSISSLYASLLVFLLLYLSWRVVSLRLQHQVGIGDRGEKSLSVAIRAQANFIEYVPLSLLLLIIFESNFGSSLYVHVLGLVLLISRLLHAWGFIRAAGATSTGRFVGTLMNWTLLLTLAVLNLTFYFAQFIYINY